MSESPRDPERILRRLEWTVIRRLDGALLGANADGLRFTSSTNTVRGLVINRFASYGIQAVGSQNLVIEGNLVTDSNFHGIGLTASATAALSRSSNFWSSSPSSAS